MADDKPIIIVKKKGGHAGHHGGAWKVAYADFVTAMMAFFMVMWLVNSAEVSTRQNIARYFRQPGMFEEGSGTPLMIGEAGILRDAFVPPHPHEAKKSAGKGEDPQNFPSRTEPKEIIEDGMLSDGISDGLIQEQSEGKGMNPSVYENPPEKIDTSDGAGPATQERAALEAIAEQIREEISTFPNLEDILGALEIKVEPDGLVVEIMDTEKRSMFALSSAKVNPEAKEAFTQVAGLLAQFSNKLDVIGHTDARPFSSRRNGGYSNWELSADRANAARRMLVGAGIAEDRLLSVVGRADKDLKKPFDPLNASNRRITLKMRYSPPTAIPISDVNPKLGKFNQRKEHNANSSKSKSTSQNSDGKTTTKRLLPYKNMGNKYRKKATKRGRKGTFPLPEETETTTGQQSPTYIKKDKIFSENPVVGPKDPFANF